MAYKKDTSELLSELESFSDFNTFYEENAPSIGTRTLSEALCRLLDEKGLTKSEVVERAQMSEVYAYQIFSGTREKPQLRKLLCLTVAMGLSLKETQELLKSCGFPQLYARRPFDCVVIYGIYHGFTVQKINEILFEYGEETLG